LVVFGVITLSPITDYSRQTLAALVKRLQQSKHLEELVYRESELDEVWRLIDMDRLALLRQHGETAGTRALGHLQAGIHAAHDLAGESDDGIAAARHLSAVIMEWGVAPARGGATS
jgi:hypothetical protein